MQALDRNLPQADAARLWRDFARLAIEGLSIGIFVSVVLGLAVLAVAGQAHANGPDGARVAAPRQGELRLEAPDAQPAESISSMSSLAVLAPLLHTDVRIDAGAMMARVTVTQSFHNPTSDWREGVYVFPLPGSAAVDHLRMQVGGRTIEGRA